MTKFKAYQPTFIKGDRARIIGNSTKNCKHFADIGTTGIVEGCKYSEKYHAELALVQCHDGLQQYIGAQDLELIPQENNSTPKFNKQKELFQMALAEKILKALGATENNETKLKNIKALALDEIWLQALKTTPGKTKLSTLTRMYKDTLKSDSDLCHGYVKMPAGFVLTDTHFLIRVDGDPLELLPPYAMENKKLTQDSVIRVINSVDMHNRQELKVNYSDIVNHIKIHGRKKTSAFFTVPGTEYSIDVFYLEYAFKLTGEKELTFSVQNPRSMWCLQSDNWSMLIAPMWNHNIGNKCTQG